MIINLTELKNSAVVAKDALWDDAKRMGRDVKLYLHWTAGDYDTVYNDYHINITGDGSIHQTCPLSQILASTYMRNTGSVAIALCCAARAAGVDDLGEYPPTAAQIETLAEVVEALADVLDLTIDLDRVMTHAEAADNLDGLRPCEPYGPANGCERWDLAVLHAGDPWMSGGDVIRGKAMWYREHEGV